MTEPDQPKIKPPRGLRGRRARQLFRELAPIVPMRADTATLLAAYCSSIAGIAEDPRALFHGELDRVQKLGRLLGLTVGGAK